MVLLQKILRTSQTIFSPADPTASWFHVLATATDNKRGLRRSLSRQFTARLVLTHKTLLTRQKTRDKRTIKLFLYSAC